MNACASCAISGVAVLPVPIAQTGSYATVERRVVRPGSPSAIASTWRRRTASVSPASRSSRVSPTQAITREPGLERRRGAPGGRLVGLAEVLPPLRVADDRAGDAGLEQHRAARPRP